MDEVGCYWKVRASYNYADVNPNVTAVDAKAPCNSDEPAYSAFGSVVVGIGRKTRGGIGYGPLGRERNGGGKGLGSGPPSAVSATRATC